MALEGFLNVLKPPGMTSHDVVAWARVTLGMRRIGHLGTLDPAAAGVLPLSLGRATRLFDYTSGPNKAYRAEIVFGLQTDTLDAEGTVIARGDASELAEGRLRGLLTRFTGEVEQLPPAFSAVSVGGRRLYERARADAEVVAPPRRVTITELELVGFAPGSRAYALLDIICSRGTYIRALADDLGRAAGCGACLGFLVRTRAGRFELPDSHPLEAIAEHVAAGSIGDCILPMDWPLVSLPCVTLNDAEALAFVRGSAVQAGSADSESAPRVRAYGPAGFAAGAVPPIALSPAGSRQGARGGSASGPAQAFLGLGEMLPGGALRPRLVLGSSHEMLGRSHGSCPTGEELPG